MRTSKVLLVTGALLILTSAAVAGYDYRVTPTISPYWNGIGELTATGRTDEPFNPPPLPLPGVGNTPFETFCAESNEGFNAGTTYWAAIDVVTGQGVPLNNATSWLFREFWAGTLPQYDFNGPNRTADAIVLQETIWHFMSGNLLPADHKFYNLVLAHYGGSVPELFNTEDIQNVRVLQLNDSRFNDPDHRHQDLLIVEPVPAPAAALLGLLGLGLVGWVKRRLP